VQISNRLVVRPIPTSDTFPEVGRIIPASSFSNLVNQLGRTNTVGLGYNNPSLSGLDGVDLAGERGLLGDLENFDVQIKIQGNGRLFTNTPVASAGLYAFKGLPFFTGIGGIFEKSDRISVTATLKTDSFAALGTGNNSAYGAKKLKICFHGYQILNPIIVSDLLGY
jgi:hypothetical protein